jgi:hypothetical protein
MSAFPTPEEAALHTMPGGICHVVESTVDSGRESAYVLLATEVTGVGYYLDENVCCRDSGGGWGPVASAGGGFTDRTLDDLRADPPRRGLWWTTDDE